MNTKFTEDLNLYYSEKIAEYEEIVIALKKKINFIASARLLIFIATIIIGYFLYPQWEIIAAMAFAALVLFLFLVKKHNILFEEKTFAEEHVSLFKEEILRLNRETADLDPGKEFVDPDHFYTSDLDIFGDGGIYQYLSRAKTISGRKKLANWLGTLPAEQEILDRQTAVTELAEENNWRHDFQSRSRMVIEKAGEFEKMVSWLNEPKTFPKSKFLQLFLSIFPLIVICAWLLTFWFLPTNFAIALSTLQILVVAGFTKKINALHGKSDEKAKLLRKYAEMIKALEEKNWESAKMQSLQHSLLQNSKASKSLFQLTSLVEALDSRANLIGTLVTNGLYMRDLKNALSIEKWKEKNKEMVPEWFSAMAEAEALASLGTFYFNNPECVFPELSREKFIIESEELAHPLIKKETRVGNNLEIKGWAQIMLISGSNMAGKSTYLRAVGVNYVLATTGAPVCAKKFRFSPIPLYTSMRIGDSIKDSESTFYAELKRIKTIIEHLQAGKPLFILLDEILRGTNSADKYTGSRALLKQLLALNGTGILATHDLGLATLEDEHPKNIRNFHFDVDITGDRFDFSYKLKRGVCKTMNATLLMQKMGIEMSDQ